MFRVIGIDQVVMVILAKLERKSLRILAVGSIITSLTCARLAAFGTSPPVLVIAGAEGGGVVVNGAEKQL